MSAVPLRSSKITVVKTCVLDLYECAIKAYNAFVKDFKNILKYYFQLKNVIAQQNLIVLINLSKMTLKGNFGAFNLQITSLQGAKCPLHFDSYSSSN